MLLHEERLKKKIPLCCEIPREIHLEEEGKSRKERKSVCDTGDWAERVAWGGESSGKKRSQKKEFPTARVAKCNEFSRRIIFPNLPQFPPHTCCYFLPLHLNFFKYSSKNNYARKLYPEILFFAYKIPWIFPPNPRNKLYLAWSQWTDPAPPLFPHSPFVKEEKSLSYFSSCSPSRHDTYCTY